MEKLEKLIAGVFLIMVGVQLTMVAILLISLVLGYPIPIEAVAQQAACF